MPFKRYVEVGRLALISYGPEYGQLVFISDVVDHNRVRLIGLLGGRGECERGGGEDIGTGDIGGVQARKSSEEKVPAWLGFSGGEY